MQLQELDTSHRFGAKVLETRRISPETASAEVRELLLELDAPGLELEVGQSLGVLAPAPAEFGQQHHLRLYSVADLPRKGPDGRPRIHIAVRRCSYVDDYSGESYEGVASNYLCDLRDGDELAMTGPFGLPFEVPRDADANLLLIATSTGIAPFRAFVRHLHERTGFQGRIWLFYGARSGLDMVYMNDEHDDFAQYYDEATFQAFRALSPRPHFGDEIDWGSTILERGKELWAMMQQPNTYVYVAGLAKTVEALERVFVKVADSPEAWERRHAELIAGKRWVELTW